MIIKILCLMLCIVCFIAFIRCEAGKKIYKAPTTISFPYGDEAYNEDVASFRGHETPEHYEIYRIDKIIDIYTFCPNVSVGLETTPYNDDFCRKCDLRTTIDQQGVVIECFDCSANDFFTEGPSKASVKSRIHNFVFFANYVQIANYSSSNI